VDLRRAVVESCDIYFYNVGLKLGIDNIAYYANAFGLGRPTGIQLAGEKSGLIPTTFWKKRIRKENWIRGETVSCSIGQGYNLVTPIQMARLSAAFANGGHLVRPVLVQKLEFVGGRSKPIQEEREVASTGIRHGTIAAVREAMRDVVHGPRGTGSRCRIPGLTAAGKTGTSQVVRLPMNREEEKMEDLPREFRDHAWFIGFAPFEEPKIAVAVIVEHVGKGGGAVAAPVAKLVMEEYLAGIGIIPRPEPDKTETAAPDENPDPEGDGTLFHPDPEGWIDASTAPGSG
jgi:penicillin-binding protein 2